MNRTRSSGQTLLEFALVIPVFLLLLFGLLDIGRAVYINNALAQAAREAARWGSVPDWSAKATTEGLACVSSPSREACVADHAKKVVVAVPSPTATATCSDVNGTTQSCGGRDQVLIVRISTQVQMFTPVIGQMLGTQTYSATAKVAVNQ